MLARIAEVDLLNPIELIALDPHYSELWLLVRMGRTPLGLLKLPRSAYGFVYQRSELWSAIERELGWNIWITKSGPAADPPTPPISVVVCTRDRAEALQLCLGALARLDYPDFEVVVVDNASAGPETAQVVAASGFRYVREERPGLDWARNRGLAEARHAIVAYTDDDVQVDAGWLRGVAAGFADPQVAAVTGLVLPAEIETTAQAYFERYGGMAKGFSPRLLHRDALGEAGVIAAHQCGVGANMAFRREALERLGGFDTALDVGTPSFGGGDIDMFHRVLAAGLALHYEPAALVWHQHRRDWPGLRRQIYSNGRAFGVYLQKIWRDRTVSRRATAEFGARWLGGWVLRRLADQLRGRLGLTWSLVWAEAWGACHARAAFRATYERDAAIRAVEPPATPAMRVEIAS
jgi:glycosyltransferase involved in cell wall biosynthesis